MLDRLDEVLKHPDNRTVALKQTFCDHFYFTTSGALLTPVLLCSIMQMRIDHVLFSVDGPFVDNGPGGGADGNGPFIQHVQAEGNA